MSEGRDARSPFERAVDEFIQTIAVPRRLREPRTADHFADVEPTVIPTRWGEVAAWREGQGAAVLLVHGWEDDHSLWSPLIDELVARGRSLVAFDLPAHGASTGDWAVSFEGSEAIKAIDATLGPLDAVVGHSAGCGVAGGAMSEGWKVDRAVLIAPAVGRDGVSRWVRKADQLGVPADVATAAEWKYLEVHGSARAAWRPRTFYGSLAIDTLVVQSRADEHNDVAAVEEVFSKNPHARTVFVDDLPHRRTARDPSVVALIADFVTNDGVAQS